MSMWRFTVDFPWFVGMNLAIWGPISMVRFQMISDTPIWWKFCLDAKDCPTLAQLQVHVAWNSSSVQWTGGLPNKLIPWLEEKNETDKTTSWVPGSWLWIFEPAISGQLDGFHMFSPISNGFMKPVHVLHGLKDAMEALKKCARNQGNSASNLESISHQKAWYGRCRVLPLQRLFTSMRKAEHGSGESRNASLYAIYPEVRPGNGSYGCSDFDFIQICWDRWCASTRFID